MDARQHQEDLLDDAIAESFPASDVPSAFCVEEAEVKKPSHATRLSPDPAPSTGDASRGR